MTDSKLKKLRPTKLLWVDLEMTGLEPELDEVIEVAAIVTDFEFNELDRYRSLVADESGNYAKLLENSDFYDQFPDNRNFYLEELRTAPSTRQVEEELIEFTRLNFGDEPATLAGNSIHQDRRFIRQYFKKWDDTMHYRMLDVSSFKILAQGRGGGSYIKKETHRAEDDIIESIEELKYYMKRFKSL